MNTASTIRVLVRNRVPLTSADPKVYWSVLNAIFYDAANHDIFTRLNQAIRRAM